MTGVVMPLTVNAAPVTATDEMLTFAVPLFVIATVFVLLVAAVTLPNARLVGFDVKVPTEAAVPLPDRLTLVGEFVALLTNLMLPLAVPEAEGANFAE